MIKQLKGLCIFIFCLLGVYGACQPANPGNEILKASNELILKDGWEMQSSLKITQNGTDLSSKNFRPTDWYQISVPSTIIGGLLANDYYDFDPFMGQNFKKLSDPALDKPWWFRKEFSLPSNFDGKNVVLKLQGVNYKANVWVNGHLIADSSAVKGPMRIIDLDITKSVAVGKNVLALEILRPFNPNRKDGDLAIDYADWIHYPPDYNAGIVNDVVLLGYDKVGVQYPQVDTHFDLPSLDVAHLTVHGLVTNYTNVSQKVEVRAVLNHHKSVSKTVSLAPGEKQDVSFSYQSFAALNIKNPKIWWPWQYGEPLLNHIKLSVYQDNKLCSAVADEFGIREVTSSLIDNHSRVFMINGKRIMLRGAAWSPDIFQRRTAKRQQQEILLYKDMHLNIIRSEGKFEDETFYDLCDKYGMLVMTGWMCCGAWQYPENWTSAERAVAMASDSSMMYWLRSKACIMVWLNGSDMPPRDPSVERDYLAIEKSLHWPNPILATANESKSQVSGYSGVKMAGPYEWVPPIYWESDNKRQYGGTWSFATEISPGPSIPPYESLTRFLQGDGLHYDSDDWNYHCGTMKFGTTKVFNTALFARYGQVSDMKDYAKKAQAQNYEAHRAMMEAYGLHKYNTATGVIQWMGANPWPSLIWHTFDYYLNPGGTYFGIKKAMEPVHVQYSYANNSVALVNSTLKMKNDLTVKAEIFNLDGQKVFDKLSAAQVGADGTTSVFSLPAPTDDYSDTYFLRLGLQDESGKIISTNWYWLSRKKDALNWSKSNWWMTPQTDYADYKSLQSMPKTRVEVKKARELVRGHLRDSVKHKITLTNKGSVVAFQIRIRAAEKKADGSVGKDILPAIYSDNFIQLAPGESRTITCSYAVKDAKKIIEEEPSGEGKGNVELEVSGWNLEND
ncbi:glycosyl hydrolase 2 galactose-binding domain-containing protein [Arachidicoccus rhizosphaerae]|nr:sugar-binding domain-containing protein [Arachidicoccus rhizosphaerae]